jgi:hypothetical protein
MTIARKVGVLTFHRCINYGSYWQARCMIEGLRSRGLEAELIDYHDPEAERREWRCALSPLLPNRGHSADLRRYARKVRLFHQAVDGLPRSQRLRIDVQNSAAYDLIVVGSDEVWNLSHPWYGGRRIFYGDRLRAGRIISYAASFGNYDATNGLAGEWADRLRNFSAISVRDSNSRALVRSAVVRDPALVLDPCLQFARHIPMTRADGSQHYTAVYGHSFPEWFQRRLRHWSDQRGTRLVSIGYRNGWADEQRLDIGPAEFAAAIAGAQSVVTNFFHGCVFAVVNSKPFLCARSPYRMNKVSDLSRLLSLEHRLIGEDAAQDEVADLLGQPLEAHVVDRLAALRSTSRAYLDAALH